MRVSTIIINLIGVTAALFLATQCSDAALENRNKPADAVSKGLNLLNEPDGIEIVYEMKDYKIVKTTKGLTDYSVIEYKDATRLNQKGYAELPYVSFAIQIPEDIDVVAKITASDEFNEHTLESPLIPSRGVIYRNQDPGAILYETDPASLTESWYPGVLIDQSSPFILRDIRGVTLRVYPFQYRSSDQTLRVYNKLKIKITRKEGFAASNILARTKDVPALITPVMEQLYRNIFVNYNNGTFTYDNLKVGERGDLLVIHTARDAAAIKPYVDWKHQKGINVITQQVGRGTNVKQTIAAAFKANPRILYVQLVGDFDDLKSDLGPQNAPMDPMLGCVAGSDNYPDLIVGRFSARSAEQVATQVEKAIQYEKNPDHNGSWYKKALGIASEEGEGMGDDDEGDFEHMAIIRNNKLLNYTYSTVYEAYKFPTRAQIAGYINGGVGLINYTGHGSTQGWVTSNYSVSDIKSSTNGSMLPIIFSVACVNGAFHNRDETFAEAFLNQKNGGAVAVLMSTINQPWTPPMRGQDYMNDILIQGYDYEKSPGDGINVTSGRNTFGSIVLNGTTMMYTESNKTEDLDTLKTWTIFGDASLEVRTDTPQAIAISSTEIHEGTPFKANVSSSSSKAQVAGATVSLSQNGHSFIGLTNNDGSVTIDHNLKKGPATLVITGHNLRPIYLSTTVL
jgi:gingipain R